MRSSGQARRLGTALWAIGLISLAPVLVMMVANINSERRVISSTAPQHCASGDNCPSSTDLRTAKAAEDMVDLAIWQMLFGLVGIYLIARTLHATRDAVREANEATDAARRALAVTQEGMQRQLRAYVHAVNASPSSLTLGEQFVMSVTIKNLGATPATKLRSRYGICIVQNPHDYVVEYPIDLATSESTLGPGLEYILTVPTSSPLTTNELSVVQNRNAFILMFADITYEDVFGVARETKIRFYVDKMTKDKLHAAPTLTGNTSS